MDSVRIIGPINSGVCAGGAGVSTATATTTHVVNGIVLGVYVKYNDSPPATTDVTIATSGSAAPAETLLTLTNKTANGWFYPRITTQDTSGVDANISSEYPYIADSVKITIAQANDADSIDVYLKVV